MGCRNTISDGKKSNLRRKKEMFSRTARYYDTIYSFKDYDAEAKQLMQKIEQEKGSDGNRLLDVACGTGMHVQYLRDYFEVQGIDLDEELLAIARKRNPGIEFHHGDMVEFDLGQSFDVIICLFSSIGYVRTLDRLKNAINSMANHLIDGGLMIIEPWITPDKWQPGLVYGKFIDEPDLKIARVNTSYVDGRLSYFDMHYLIGTTEKTEHFVERHELGLFTIEETLAVMLEAGLNVTHDEEGLSGRGLYIGRKMFDETK
jgi:SAM-dependent methyltransferase